MKHRKTFLVLIFVGIAAVLFLLLYFSLRTFKLRADDISKVTIQYKLNYVTLDKPEELKKFNDIFMENKFTLHGSAMGRKGWIYWIKCYDSKGTMLHNFTILNKNLIINHELFYKAKGDGIDLSYFQELFK